MLSFKEISNKRLKIQVLLFGYLIFGCFSEANTLRNSRTLSDSPELSPEKSSQSGLQLNFSEGGSIKNDDYSNKTEQSNSLIEVEGSIAPKGEGKGVKARKGAKDSPVVPRKEAPPPPCPNCTTGTPVHEDSSPPPTILSDNNNSQLHSKTINKSINIVHKPSVTVAPADSSQLEEMLRKERNVVIPVAALVCAPILVLLALFIFKRIEESRGNANYTRMGFLIEDIYND